MKPTKFDIRLMLDNTNVLQVAKQVLLERTHVAERLNEDFAMVADYTDISRAPAAIRSCDDVIEILEALLLAAREHRSILEIYLQYQYESLVPSATASTNDLPVKPNVKEVLDGFLERYLDKQQQQEEEGNIEDADLEDTQQRLPE